MTCSCQTDDDGWYPGGNSGQGLGKHGKDGEECKYQHGTHAANVGIHATLLNKQLGQISAIDADYRYDEVEHKEQHLTRHGGDRIAQRVEIVRCPEEEEPPHTVGKQFAHDKSPCLPIFKAIPKRQLDFIIRIVGGFSLTRFCIFVGFDIEELLSVDKRTLGW